jgi:hypothetical protein
MQQAPGLVLTKRAIGAVTMYRCVTFSGAQVGTQGAKALGVAQINAIDGEDFSVAVDGTVIVEIGAAVAIGDALICDAQGRVIPSTGPLVLKAGAIAVTSVAASGAVLQGGDPPEFVLGDALEASIIVGAKIEMLLRR